MALFNEALRNVFPNFLSFYLALLSFYFRYKFYSRTAQKFRKRGFQKDNAIKCTLWFFNLVRVHKQLLFKPVLWSYNTGKIKLLLLQIFKAMASYGYYLYFLKPVANFLNVKLKIQSSYEYFERFPTFLFKKLCRKIFV